MRSGRSPARADRAFTAALAALLLLVPPALPGVPILRGVVVESDQIWLSLQNPGKRDEAWVKVGGNYHGYRVARWDGAREIAELQRPGETLLLPLVAGAATTVPQPAGGPEMDGIMDNLHRLTVSACQHLLEQGGTAVHSGDLVGHDSFLFKLEPVADENYADIFFVLEPDGLKMSVGGAPLLVLAAAGPLRIQVAPTQSLTAISQRLRIPLENLRRLNPQHAAADRIGEWTSVRLN